jgi:AcrR family transcriptional regulator
VIVPTAKERILDTAERLFAERGYAATSLRSIITEANVNLASVHYHFHSKEALLEAVFLRRAVPSNLERLQMLELCERDAADGPPELSKIIEAFIMPAFLAAKDPSRGGPVFRRLLGRLYAEGDLMPGIIMRHFVPLLDRFFTVLERSLPELPREELYWRIHFAMGSIALALRGTGDWEVFEGPLHDSGDNDLMLRRLVNFLDAAFRAPVISMPESSEPAPVAAAVVEEK